MLFWSYHCVREAVSQVKVKSLLREHGGMKKEHGLREYLREWQMGLSSQVISI